MVDEIKGSNSNSGINNPLNNQKGSPQSENRDIANIEVASQLYKGMQGVPEQNQPQQPNLESSLVSSVNTLPCLSHCLLFTQILHLEHLFVFNLSAK